MKNPPIASVRINQASSSEGHKKRQYVTLFLLFFCFFHTCLLAQSVTPNPIIFVTSVPNPRDFGTMAATFGNHGGSPDSTYRGGDLWIRYPDGSLRNLTSAAGFGNDGFQGAAAISVRDPSVSWDGKKVIFSMIVGAPTKQYQVTQHRWQLYEISNFGLGETPIISKVPFQSSQFNNISPVYASDQSILFISDRPRDDSVLHTYPQRDEYESSPVNSGVWKLNSITGVQTILDHAPSGNFNPIIDSYGRVIFTRWDHLQRDQQNVGASFGAYNFESEGSTIATASTKEYFPEPRTAADPDYIPTVNTHSLNQFFPWMMNQDGTGLETLNHIGRQEIGLYSERSFNNDPNVQEFYSQYATGNNKNRFSIFLHIKEDPLVAGTYYGTSCQEFGTHSAGQIISITGGQGLNPNDMQVSYLTHPDTSGASSSPSANHSGLYRDPLPLRSGTLIASHTSNTQEDRNVGSSEAPQSRYDFKLKTLNKVGDYYTAGQLLTTGISKSVSFWSPDQLITYSGQLWELMPVEVVSRNPPQSTGSKIPDPEMSVITSLGIDPVELESYLKQQNLALIVSRNVTTRDKNDRQQPTNLRVAGTQTESLPHSGKIYDISLLQIFQGDLIRSYNNGSMSGRRVLAQPLHSIAPEQNLSSAQLPSAVQIAEDGSTAAFVPARRALSWQLTDATGAAVVRERYWLTFQPGEIRVCASCHGINTTDHLGNGEPKNPPQALAKLLANWKNLPKPSFTPSPTATANPSASSSPEIVSGKYSLGIAKRHLKKGNVYVYLTVQSNRAEKEEVLLGLQINGVTCAKTKTVTVSKVKRKIVSRLPAQSGLRVRYLILQRNSKAKLAEAQTKFGGRSSKLSNQKITKLCTKSS